MYCNEYTEELYAIGVVIEKKGQGIFVVRLEDGRVLPFCQMGRGRMTGKVFPEIGERAKIVEAPYATGQGRITLIKPTKRKQQSQSSPSETEGK